MKNFCPNCGHAIKSNATFCPNCGYNLLNKESKVNQVNSGSVKKVEKSKFCPICGKKIKGDAKICPNCGHSFVEKKVDTGKNSSSQRRKPALQKIAPKKRLSKRKKFLLILVAILIVAGGSFYAWGSNHYSRENQIDRIANSLTDSNVNVAQYITTDNSDVEINNNTIKPLRTYYQNNKKVVDTMRSDYKAGLDSSEHVDLVQSGHYMLIFPKYVLKVKTYSPKVQTNHYNSTLNMNKQNMGSLRGSGDNYSKKISAILPGEYHFIINSQVSGRKLSATSNVNVWSNKAIDMNIRTDTFTVKSVPNGLVYINDKKVGTLDSKGNLKLKDYPITKNMNLYVTTTYNKKQLKSEQVANLGSALKNADERSDESDDSHIGDIDDNDDETEDESDIVYTDGGNYIVSPEWRGLISDSDAKNLLESVFKDNDSSTFVNGSDNSDYKDIKKLHSDWDSQDVDLTDFSVEIESITPAGDNYSAVNFKAKFEFQGDDFSKDQTMEYTGALLYNKDDDTDKQKIKSIGKGKMLSSKKHDLDDDD